MSGAPRLLVLRALGLGDLLTAVPALRGLRRAFPDHRLQLAAPPALAGFIALLDRVPGGPALVDDPLPAGPLEPLPPVACGAAVAVNLHGRGPQSHRLLQASRPARLLAFACPQAGVPGGPVWRAGEHERDRWSRMLAAFGVASDPADLRIGVPPGAPPVDAAGATVIHPGAAAPARRWPAERWAQVAATERAAGHTVLLTGSAAERPLAEQIADRAGLPAGAVLAGRCSPAELARVVGAAGRFASGDTGPAHLASALGTPSVVLFGPVPPREWGPPRGGRHHAIWHGRRGDPHARGVDPGLLAVEVDEVRAALAALRRAAAPAAD